MNVRSSIPSISALADKVPSSLDGTTPYIVTAGFLGVATIVGIFGAYLYLPENERGVASLAIVGVLTTLIGIIAPVIKGQQDLAKLNVLLATAQVEHTERLVASTDSLKRVVDGQSDQLRAASKRADYAEGQLTLSKEPREVLFVEPTHQKESGG